MYFPEEFINRVRTHFLTSQVIGKYISIRKKGREYHACCPFHKEKTPSFTINDEKGFYHCFGCNQHGDALRFVMEYEKLSYPDAIAKLARDAGITLPISDERTRFQDKKIKQKREILLEITAFSAKFFTHNLINNTGYVAREYLHNRGLNAAIIKKFNIGYATSERNSLKNILIKQGYNEKHIKEAGMLSQPDKGESYDKFRSRIIFPICDNKGNIIAFGGRAINASPHAPKYLNSPDTPLFNKGNLLYNMSNARRHTFDNSQLIIVEGYMDVIALTRFGFAESVAPLGTAITEYQLGLAWTLVDEPIICLDGDSAGERAMIRSAELALPLLSAGKSLKFSILPKGEDPDSYLEKNGRKKFLKKLNKSLTLIDVLWNIKFASLKPNTPERIAGAEKKLFGAVNSIKDEQIKNYYIREFRSRIWEYSKTKPKKNNNISSNLKSLPKKDDYNLQLKKCGELLLAIILYYPNILNNPEIEELFLNINIINKDIKFAILNIFSQDNPPKNSKELVAILQNNHSKIIENIQNNAKNDINLMILCKNNIAENAKEYFEEIVKRAETINIRKESTNNKNFSDEAEFERFKKLNENILNDESRYNRYGEDD